MIRLRMGTYKQSRTLALVPWSLYFGHSQPERGAEPVQGQTKMQTLSCGVVTALSPHVLSIFFLWVARDVNPARYSFQPGEAVPSQPEKSFPPARA